MPERVSVTLVEVVLLSPVLMLIVGLLGTVVSLTTKVMPSKAESETFPAVSLNQTYTLREWFPTPEALARGKLTVGE